MDALSAVFTSTPQHILECLGARAKARRLLVGLTQQDLALRAAVSVDAIKRLESSGRIGLETLARIAVALDASGSLEAIFSPPSAQSLDELESQSRVSTRVYAKRRDAGIARGPRVRAPNTAIKPSR